MSMKKRSIEDLIAEVRQFKITHDVTTFAAMSSVLEDDEWDRLMGLFEQRQKFWAMHMDMPGEH